MALSVALPGTASGKGSRSKPVPSAMEGFGADSQGVTEASVKTTACIPGKGVKPAKVRAAGKPICPGLPKKVVPWALRVGERAPLGLAGGGAVVALVKNEAGDELEVSAALPSTPYVAPFKKDCRIVYPYLNSAYNPCGYVTFYDANWETSEKAPDNNWQEDAQYDACGKLVTSGKTSGWHVIGTEYTLFGWHAGHEATIPSSVSPPCLGTWTLLYRWEQEFSDGEILVEDIEVPFLVTEAPLPVSATWGGGNPAETPCVQACHGDPVNTATGDYYETTTDLSIPGRGPGLRMARTYSSRAADAGITSALGRGWSFSYDMSLSVDPETEAATVTNSNGSQTLFHSGSEGFFAEPRVLATLVENESGTYTYTVKKRTIYTFDAEGKLIGITDLNGEETTLSYNESGRLQKAEDGAGRSLTFEYDESGRLESVSDSTERSVAYDYDEAGYLEKVTDVRGGSTEFTYDEDALLLTRTDPRENTVLTNTYDTSGRVLTQTDGLENQSTFVYAGSGLITTTIVTNPRGHKTEYEYRSGILTKRVEAAGTNEKATWTYEHDPETLGITSVTDPNGNTSYVTYDLSGNKTSTEDAMGRTTESVYDSLDNLTEYTDASGITTTYEYDESGNLLSSSTPLVGSEPPKSRTVVYFYEDEAHPGDLTGITDPNGETTNFVYDTAGNLKSVIDPLGNETSYTYDERGNLKTEVSPRGNVEGGEPTKYTTSFTYDAAGNHLLKTNPLGDEWEWTYDANGNIETETDANGHVTTYSYDAANRPISVERPNGQIEQTTYDKNGNVAATIDGLERETTYTYDRLDRRSTSTDPLGRTTDFRYYQAGDLRLLIDPQGRATFYGYNDADELVEIEYEDEDTPDVQFDYDLNGRLVSMDDGTGESTYEYDSLGRLVEATNGHGDSTAYDHDLAGNVTSIEYPNGKSVTRSFDDAGRMESVSDWLGNTTSFAYDPNSNLETMTFPEGTGSVDEFAYDRTDRISAIDMKRGPETLASLDYLRDKVGQLESVTTVGLPGPESEAFEYDENDRLTQAGSDAFEYDDANNLTKAPGTTNTYDAASQLKSGTGIAYRYDRLGARTEGGPFTAIFDSSFGSSGSEGGQFDHPAGIATDAKGDVWVVDQENNRLQKFSPAGEYLESFGSAGSEAGQLEGPTDVAIDPEGHLWVTDAGNSRVQEFSPTGEYLSQFGSPGSEAGQFSFPESLDVDSEGDIWVADTYNSRLQEFDQEGELIQAVGEWGSEEGQIIEATDVAIGPEDSVWLVDYSNSRVSEFDQEGKFVGQFGDFGSGEGQFEGASAIDVDSKGNIWVADEWIGRVQKFNEAGEYLGEFGSPGTGEGEFSFGWRMGIAADEQGNIWVADTEGDRVQRWEVPLSGGPPSIKYAYDQAGDLTAVERAESGEISAIDESYAYDGSGLRASQTVSEVTSHLTWDQSAELPLLLSDEENSYIYGPGGMPIQHISAEKATFYHRDQLGSTRMLTDESGKVTGTFSYGAYGKLSGSTGTATTPLGYAGQYTNAESGLQYLRARTYDPATGQFLTKDPLATAANSPYTYANNNPLRFVDPSGACGVGSVGDALESINPLSPENCAYQAADSVVNLLGGNAEVISQVTGVLAAGLAATGYGAPVAAALAGLSAATGAYAAGQSAANGEAVSAALNALGAALGSEALAFKLFSAIARNGIKDVRWLHELGQRLERARDAREVAAILDEAGYGVLITSLFCPAFRGV